MMCDPNDHEMIEKCCLDYWFHQTTGEPIDGCDKCDARYCKKYKNTVIMKWVMKRKTRKWKILYTLGPNKKCI
jgi:hypothetical protein